MLKMIFSSVIAILVSSIILTAISKVPQFDFENKCDSDKKSTSAVTTVIPSASDSSGQSEPAAPPDNNGDAGGELPGAETPGVTDSCPEEIEHPDIVEPEVTTAAPQIDYGWGEEPGPS